MSQYMHELCDALTRVLDHAAQLDRRRLAGYAQNIDFWISEVQHRLNLIDGYIARRQGMIAGTNAVYRDDILRSADLAYKTESLTTPNVIDTSTNWEDIKTDIFNL